MRQMLLVCLSVQILFSCSFSTNNKVAKPVEGAYVMQTKGEFSISEDTLVITAIQNQTDLFSVVRSVGYQRITEKGILPRELKREKSMAIWYGESSQLKEQKRGRVYSLSADGNQMLIGSSVYTRIGN